MGKLIRKSGQQGFTLIELLVVIGILAALAAVAMPAYSRFFLSGEAEANAAEILLLQDALDSMLADNRINTVVPQPDPTNDFSALPTGPGTEVLFPAFLRSSNTKCAYTWEADGFLTQTGCNEGGSEEPPPEEPPPEEPPPEAPPSIADLQDQVEALRGLGTLNNDQAAELQDMLTEALDEMAEGDLAEATEALSEFIEEIDEWVAEGTQQGEDMQPLIDVAEALLLELGGQT